MTRSQAIRHCIEHSTMFATRFFFASQYHQKFNIGEHHEKMAEAFDRVFRGETQYLMINVPPRHSKTEFVKAFEEGGYEARTTNFTPETPTMLQGEAKAKLARHIEKL